jgi:hypothetical protein
MTNETGAGRRLRAAAAMAVAAAVVTLAAGCGVVHVHFGSSGSAQRTTYRDNLAYAQCMRSHGLPGFPDPGPSGTTTFSGQLTGDSPAGRANAACEHLLPS